NFVLDSVIGHGMISLAASATGVGDTAVLGGLELGPPVGEIIRDGVAFSLIFKRTAAGDGAIIPEVVSRSELWRPSVERDHDLLEPTIIFTEYEPPPDTLFVSETDLYFEAVAGEPCEDSFFVEVTSNTDKPLQFSLTPSEPWIEVIFFTVIEPTTPETVLVKINTDLTPIGTNVGRIDVIPWDEAVTPVPPQINVTAEILEPLLYPPGDFNCDGVVDIADVTMMIAFLFLGGPPLEHCR
ncbi:MAG: hypothetical protein JSU65_02140, partial [Candidatus Zixiibacteriota bacterium]